MVWFVPFRKRLSMTHFRECYLPFLSHASGSFGLFPDDVTVKLQVWELSSHPNKNLPLTLKHVRVKHIDMRTQTSPDPKLSNFILFFLGNICPPVPFRWAPPISSFLPFRLFWYWPWSDAGAISGDQSIRGREGCRGSALCSKQIAVAFRSCINRARHNISFKYISLKAQWWNWVLPNAAWAEWEEGRGGDINSQSAFFLFFLFWIRKRGVRRNCSGSKSGLREDLKEVDVKQIWWCKHAVVHVSPLWGPQCSVENTFRTISKV